MWICSAVGGVGTQESGGGNTSREVLHQLAQAAGSRAAPGARRKGEGERSTDVSCHGQLVDARIAK